MFTGTFSEFSKCMTINKKTAILLEIFYFLKRYAVVQILSGIKFRKKGMDYDVLKRHMMFKTYSECQSKSINNVFKHFKPSF